MLSKTRLDEPAQHHHILPLWSCPATHPSFEGFRTDVPQRAVAPLAVVVDVFKHGLAHLAAADEALAVDAYDLQAVEEAFGVAHALT